MWENMYTIIRICNKRHRLPMKHVQGQTGPAPTHCQSIDSVFFPDISLHTKIYQGGRLPQWLQLALDSGMGLGHWAARIWC